jgi:sigma-B regulation protein RsbU (phosphoserine phosphatase)
MPNSKDLTRIERLLLEAARVFNATLEYEEITQLILKMVLSAVDCEAALVFRVDHDRTDMKIRFMNASDFEMNIFHLELGQGVVGWVARYKEPVVINNAANDPRVDAEIVTKSGVDIKSVITVPLIGKGQMIGVIEAINHVDGSFTDGDLDILVGLSNQMAVAIDNANLYRQLKQEMLKKDLLYELGKKLSGSLSLDEVLNEIVQSLKRVVDFDAGGVFVIDSDKGEIDSLYVVGYGPTLEADLHLKMGQGLVGFVAAHGEPMVVSDVSQDDRYINSRDETKSEILVPITLEDRVIGVFNLESNRLNAYDKHDQLLLMTFASQAAISIERARLHRQILAGKRIEEQLNIARQIQFSFLPASTPTIPGYDVVGRNIPSEQVGGDYYDFIRIVDSQTGIAIGDVSGKGIPASLIMASFRASLIAEIRNNYAIRAICQKVNNLLYESITGGNFVTAVYGVLDSKNHIFTFCNCGHNLPVFIRRNGEVQYLKEGGQVLGVTAGAIYEERPIFLDKGDLVMFYTDGVTEVFNADSQEFGLARLVELLKESRGKPSAEIQDIVYLEAKAFASTDHIFDDFTTIVLKRL